MSQFTNEGLFKEVEGKTLSYFLNKTCEENNIDKIKYIFESDFLEVFFGIDKSGILSDALEEIEGIILDSFLIQKCCELNCLEILKYLLEYCHGYRGEYTLDELKYQLNEGSLIACEKGSVDALDYILNSKEIKMNAKIDNDAMFYRALSNNQVNILEYLFKLPQMKQNIDFGIRSGELLQLACAYSNLNTIKCILNYPEFKDKINIHIKQDEPFSLLVRKGKTDVISYLIFELNIEKTKDIKDLLTRTTTDEIEKMFAARELKAELQIELKEDIKNNPKKNKI
jgi:hypothetical protein